MTVITAAEIDAARGTPRAGWAGMQRTVQWILLIFVGLLVVGPLVVLLRTSFSPAGALPLASTAFTLRHYVSLLTGPDTLGLLLNTIEYAGGSVVLSVCITFIIAWLTERTDMPGRTAVRIFMFSWMAIPPLVFAYGWILLVNPSNGVLNNILIGLFGFEEAPLSPYSMTAMIVISALGLTPTTFVMLSGLLRNMDPMLEDAAFVQGASRRTILRRITLPLLRPGILSVGMYLFMGMVQTFDFPLIIGLSARIPVLSTRIYTLASPEVGGLPNYGLAAAFGIFLLLLALVLMWGYFRAIRIGERFRVVSGRAFRPRRIALGLWRFPAALAVGFYFALMLMPVLNLLWASLLPYYQAPSWDAASVISFGAYARVLEQGIVHRALANTVFLILVSGTAVMGLSLLVSWYSVRGKGRMGKWLDTLSFSPIAVPPIVMAIAVLLLYLKSPLYGTIWILVIGHVTVYLAFGTRTMISALLQLHKELEDAAIISGASWLTSLRRVVLPLLWGHIVNGWLWVVAHSARDLTFPLLLMTTSNVVGASAIWMIWDYPDLPGAAALSMILVAGLMLIVVPVQILSARQMERGRQ